MSRFSTTKFLLAGLCLGMAAVSTPALAVKNTGGEYNTLFAGLGVKGYDVVAYFTEGKPTPGSDRHTVDYGGVKWRFASRKHRELFAADPVRYAPQFGGFCSWGVANGKLFDVDPVNGWQIVDGRLYLNFNPTEAELVRQIFERYNALGNVRYLKNEFDERGITRKHWRGSQTRFSCGGLYNMLRNPIYIGEIPHKEVSYPGLHQAIIERGLWDSVQSKLTDQAGRARHEKGRKTERSLLIGKLRDESGAALTPIHANKAGRRYRYYSSPALLNGGASERLQPH